MNVFKGTTQRSRRLLAALLAVAFTSAVLTNSSCEPLFANVGGRTTCGVAASSARRRRRRGDRAASYSRFSSHHQREDSIGQQEARCREVSTRNGHELGLLFSDHAISGTKRKRKGLNDMLEAAERSEFDVLYLFSLSRLARESVITMPILKRLVQVHSIRVISISDGLDTNQDNWSLMASIMSAMHEQYLKDLAENVRRGQEAAIAGGYSVGDLCFGFGSEPVPGSEVQRPGRNAKPRMTYVVNVTEATWVMRIFHWFVVERRSRTWIARELTRRGVPKDRRATTDGWTPAIVTRLLRNEKYAGIWRWGRFENVRDPETGNVFQDEREPEDSDRWTRTFKHLRIVPDETFRAAQLLLDEATEKHAGNHDEDGRFTGSTVDPNNPRHLLQGLLKCECGASMQVCGGNGAYLGCRAHRTTGTCSVTTQLRRDLAESILVDEIGRLIGETPAWFDAVHDALLTAWRERTRRVPVELAEAERRLSDIEMRIKRLVDAIEEGRDDPDVTHRLRHRRAEREELAREVEKLRAEHRAQPSEPTRGWLREKLERLGTTLREGTPAAALALRALVGGEIVVFENRIPGMNKRYFQGSFVIRTKQVLEALGAASDDTNVAERVGLDFRDTLKIEEQAEIAMDMLAEGFLMADIGEALGVGKSRVTKIVKYAHESRGLPIPDGRRRRATLSKKHRQSPAFQAIADECKALVDDGLLIVEIADELDCNVATVRKALDWWHESRGLELEDGRSRRKSLTRKSRPAGVA